MKLTHLPLGENGGKIAVGNLKYIFVDDNWLLIFIDASSLDMTDEKSSLVYIMAWHRTAANPLSKSMMTHFCDAHMRQLREMC